MKLNETEKRNNLLSFLKKSGKISLVLSLGIGLIGCSSSAADPSEKEETEIVEEEKADTSSSEQNEVKEETPSEDTAAEDEKKAEPEEKAQTESVPREYRAALSKAETYSEMMHMSRQGIYDQLVSEYGEGFPPEAAQYAVDNLKADYNQNALEKARTYAEMMDMSDSAIYDQLISEYGEQFTPEEAEYAIAHLND